jgi:hypothetical protein
MEEFCGIGNGDEKTRNRRLLVAIMGVLNDTEALLSDGVIMDGVTTNELT